MKKNKKKRTRFILLGYICTFLVTINALFLFLMGIYVPFVNVVLITSFLVLYLSPLYLLGIIIQMIFRFNVTKENLGPIGMSVFLFMVVTVILHICTPGGPMAYPVTDLGMKLNVKMNGGYDELQTWAQSVIEKNKNAESKDGVEYVVHEEEWPDNIKNIVKHGDISIRIDKEQPDIRYVVIFYGHNKPGYWGIKIGGKKPEESPYDDNYYIKWNSHIYSYFNFG